MTETKTIRPIVLWGMMGSGKSTVGRLLAADLQRPFYDLDQVVSERCDMTIECIFSEHGEVFFRKLEHKALQQILDETPEAVIALGGGTLLQPEVREHIQKRAYVITLDASAGTLEARVGTGQGRPLLKGHSVRERLDTLLADRKSAYADVHWRISTDGRTPSDIASDIVQHVGWEVAA